MSETIFMQLYRLGDCVQSTVVISSWRSHYPEDRIVVLTRPAFAPAFQGNPDIDELLLCNPPDDVSKLNEADLSAKNDPLFPVIKDLKQRNFHAVINLTHDEFGRWLATQLQCEVLRGFVTDNQHRIIANDPWSLYLLSFLRYRRLNLLNLIDIYAQLSRAPAVRDTPQFIIDGQCRSEVAQWLDALQPAGCLVGFQPGANLPERRWPAENFIQLGQDLVKRHNVQVLVLGAGNEEPLARSIADNIPNAKSFAGKTSVSQLAALLERCKVLVTNDTGTMHVAAAVGTRIVALFESSAYFRETGPYGSGHWIIQSRQLLEYGERTEAELRMMQRIPVENVVTVVDSILSGYQGEEALSLPGEGADYYRSLWADGVVDSLPVVPTPIQPEDLAARIQKPIWMALLHDRDVDASQAADEALAVLKKYYAEPVEPSVPQMLEQFLRDARRTEASLLKLRSMVDLSLQKLRKNPGFQFSQDHLAGITNGEKAILDEGKAISVQPFVEYFDIALAMVTGANTRELFQNYRRHVIFFEQQLKALQAVLTAARAHWK